MESCKKTVARMLHAEWAQGWHCKIFPIFEKCKHLHFSLEKCKILFWPQCKYSVQSIQSRILCSVMTKKPQVFCTFAVNNLQCKKLLFAMKIVFFSSVSFWKSYVIQLYNINIFCFFCSAKKIKNKNNLHCNVALQKYIALCVCPQPTVTQNLNLFAVQTANFALFN